MTVEQLVYTVGRTIKHYVQYKSAILDPTKMIVNISQASRGPPSLLHKPIKTPFIGTTATHKISE